jgi:NAD(P)H-dependent flavin oxidoreductase YrpB (nitropropane dioxygenase family)
VVLSELSHPIARAAQIGTAFMRAPEAATHPAHADALATDTDHTGGAR